ncbi:MAG TPA: biotin--[acetyl-CoA-carboxylase] ligase [Dehalococcoidia bacterium]|nr:biotin--[acetyl-CoA-carboxylase] ligase [Dehalococcoidia bacterium]
MSGEIDVERVQASLSERWRLVYRREVDSTMTVARALANAGAPAGTVVLAEEQTAGRGRMGRSWVSVGGVNLYFTAILRPSLTVLRQLAMVVPLAVAEGVEAVCPVRTEIKWPNDVQMDGLKLSGVLIDAELRGDEPALALVGVGINVNFAAGSVPELRGIATSLSERLGQPLERGEVLRAVLMRLATLLDESERGGAVRDRWRARLNTLGRRITVRAGETIETGLAVDVTDDGGLVLERDDGSRAVLAAGEVTLHT